MSKKDFYLSMFMAALIGGLVAVGGFYISSDQQAQEFERMRQRQDVRFSSYIDPSEFTIPEGLNFVYAAETTTPAVVHIRSKYSTESSGQAQNRPRHPFEEMFPDMFGEPGQRPRGQQGIPRGASGSGVIISDDGFIVTNNHVIDNANSIEVVLSDNRKYDATLVGTDPSTDIAVLKIEEQGLPFVKYGNSDDIRVGEWVLAVGNPLDLTSTVTAGIISAKGRSIGILQRQSRMSIESFIQTDAAVNPGNSGGALVNLKGELIGVNTAIASPTGSYSGYSFAVPASLVAKIVEDLREHGTVQRALLGVEIRDVNADLAKEEGLKVNRGVFIAGVNENSAADEANLQEGDVIVAINDRQINTVAQLQESIATSRPGETVEVSFYRNGRLNTADVTLKNSMGTTAVVVKNEEPLDMGGANLSNLSKQDRQKYRVDSGVKVEEVGEGKWKRANIREGFVITAVDNKKVSNVDELLSILKSKQGQGALIEGVYPNGEKAYYGMAW
jgi:serine protease Do